MAFPLTSLPDKKKKKKIPEGATARCGALISARVSGWGVITSRLQLGEGVLIPISKKLYYSKYKDFCHDIRTSPRRPLFLPSLEKESLGENRADGQSEETV